LSDWKGKDPITCSLFETHLKQQDTNRLNINGWRELYHIKPNQKRAGATDELQTSESSQQGRLLSLKTGNTVII
jgi:hypothetical protein